MIHQNDIYTILEHLANQQEIIDVWNMNNPDKDDIYLEYSVINDFTLHIEHGFNSYEEDQTNIIDIILNEYRILITSSLSGHSCMIGDYNITNDNKQFFNIQDFMTWIKEEINYNL